MNFLPDYKNASMCRKSQHFLDMFYEISWVFLKIYMKTCVINLKIKNINGC